MADRTGLEFGDLCFVVVRSEHTSLILKDLLLFIASTKHNKAHQMWQKVWHGFSLLAFCCQLIRRITHIAPQELDLGLGQGFYPS